MNSRKYDWEPGELGDEYIAKNLPDGISATVQLHTSDEYWCWEVGIRGAFAITGESSSAQDCIRQVENKIAENLQYVDAEDKAIPYGPFLGGVHKKMEGKLKARREQPSTYRLCNANCHPKDVYQTLNEWADEGYRVVAVVPDDGRNSRLIIMEHFEDAGSFDLSNNSQEATAKIITDALEIEGFLNQATPVNAPDTTA